MPAAPKQVRWEAQPHTLAKVQILKTYLHAWFQIMGRSQRSKDLLYIDGFAGPGSYTNAPEGSPLAALSALSEVKRVAGDAWRAGNVHIALVEGDKKRFAALAEAVRQSAKTPDVFTYLIDAPFEEAMEHLRNRVPQFFLTPLPLFAFIDPFGVKGFRFESVRELLASQTSEILVNFDADGVARVLRAGDAAAYETILTDVYGSAAWRGRLNAAQPTSSLVRDCIAKPEPCAQAGNLQARRHHRPLVHKGRTMSRRSAIEWTEMTWNPVSGCTKVSPGCVNCYAERMARRLKAMGADRYRDGFALRTHEVALEEPLRWKAPRKVFVNSMSDLFHKDVPLEFSRRVFHIMAQCPQHQFQILTKRAARLRELAPGLNWTPNIWMGVSVEDQKRARRAMDLSHVPARVRFLSVEPLLGPINELPLEGIDWVIVGGESGPGARAMEAEWVDILLRQCRARGVAFFFKQWGGVQKHRTGRALRGRTYDEMPSLSKSNIRPAV